METFRKKSFTREYHIYEEQLNTAIGEELECQHMHRNAVTASLFQHQSTPWPHKYHDKHLTEQLVIELIVSDKNINALRAH